jgi:hypothetical protein
MATESGCSPIHEKSYSRGAPCFNNAGQLTTTSRLRICESRVAVLTRNRLPSGATALDSMRPPTEGRANNSRDVDGATELSLSFRATAISLWPGDT